MNLENLDYTQKSYIKKFFARPEVEMMVLGNFFDALFECWKLYILNINDIEEGSLDVKDLTTILEEANIDYLPFMSKLIFSMFKDYQKNDINLTKNVEEIDPDVFGSHIGLGVRGDIRKFYYPGTAQEFLSIKGSRQLLNNPNYNFNQIQVICKDQTLINRARDYSVL